MKRELKLASEFGTTILMIDNIANRMKRTLDKEQEKAIARTLERQSQEKQKNRRRSSSEMITANRKRASSGVITTVSQSYSMYDAVNSITQNSNTGNSPVYRSKSRKEVRARFPTPQQFIYKLLHTDLGYTQLQHLHRIIKMLRLQHISLYEINEKRKLQTTDCVNTDMVYHFLKAGSSNYKEFKANGLLSPKSKTKQKLKSNTFKSNKNNNKNDENESAYDDEKILGEIVHKSKSLYSMPFLMFNCNKQLLLDEIKLLPYNVFP
eukprot:TRINITY_DN60023_c0_g1_i2.p1 TRINITY_DN60023_c0_g1~~TRINITY_DN60023_c0_g1_i2.p1  ORF type:complete len:265 (-),score=-2.66 TRINITY_DN60023_c0_g1_i2:22-816(-)